VLFAGAKLANFINDRRHQTLGRPLTISSQRFAQALLAEFLSRIGE